jgi:hypothetical protein
MQATGTFEVKVVPLPADEGTDTGGFGRLSLDKTFSGGLTATSKGQMIGAFTAVEGSAGYVALGAGHRHAEWKEGELHPAAQRDDEPR